MIFFTNSPVNCIGCAVGVNVAVTLRRRKVRPTRTTGRNRPLPGPGGRAPEPAGAPRRALSDRFAAGPGDGTLPLPTRPPTPAHPARPRALPPTRTVRLPAPSRRVLVVGSGAREHALAWKLARDGAEVFTAPGNAGTAAVGENLPVAADDFPGLLAAARKHACELTVVGPEAPLVGGIVDLFHGEGMRVFGPTAAAARIEGSKAFCKQILRRGDVPTALHREFRSAAGAVEYLESRDDMPVVVKADGLAAGKGVVVCAGRAEAVEAVNALARDPQFAVAARTILIEERLDGPEVSVMAVTDGRTIVTLPPLQDHKAAHDGDVGPNTGGMGAYCPTPFVDAATSAEIEARILVPTVHAMRRSNVPFHGVLFAGLMLTPQGPKVLEFNARFGDPECETLMALLDSSLLEILDAAVDRRLESIAVPAWRPGAAVTVVMASEGYPGPVAKGRAIRGLDEAAAVDGVTVFHAATRAVEGPDGPVAVNDGGRTLAVTAVGDSLANAKRRAYSAVRCIRWDGAWCRKDIADKGIDRERIAAAATEPER